MLKTCRKCGAEYDGQRKSAFCPSCDAKMKPDPHRKIGSTDICQLCGKPYTVRSTRQRFCPSCRKELDAQPPTPREERACVVCGKRFIPTNCQITCSPECRAIRKKMVSDKAMERIRAEQSALAKQRCADKLAAMSPEERKDYLEKSNAKALERRDQRSEKIYNQICSWLENEGEDHA